jgi:predicted N-formylglutamate amidohydrolase
MAGPLPLLDPDEPDPVGVHNPDGAGAIVLVCEHAGNLLPRRLGDLGLSAADRQRHIAWDIGAGALSRLLAERLDAPLITQAYSRLVCDCNRATGVESYIPVVSEATRIPGNEGLGAAERQARTDAIYWPLHRRITALLDQRAAAGRPTAFINIHSFTPVYLGVARPMQVGLLFQRDRRLADLVGSALRADGRWLVTDNEPYALDPARDYTTVVHGEGRGLPSLELEIRQDLIGDPAGQAAWAAILAPALDAAVRHLLRELG